MSRLDLLSDDPRARSQHLFARSISRDCTDTFRQPFNSLTRLSFLVHLFSLRRPWTSVISGCPSARPPSPSRHCSFPPLPPALPSCLLPLPAPPPPPRKARGLGGAASPPRRYTAGTPSADFTIHDDTAIKEDPPSPPGPTPAGARGRPASPAAETSRDPGRFRLQRTKIYEVSVGCSEQCSEAT